MGPSGMVASAVSVLVCVKLTAAATGDGIGQPGTRRPKVFEMGHEAGDFAGYCLALSLSLYTVCQRMLWMPAHVFERSRVADTGRSWAVETPHLLHSRHTGALIPRDRDRDRDRD